jgi:uncharacterized protein
VTLYLDTSAVTKLVIVERETQALRTLLQVRSDAVRATSAITRCELVRAVRRLRPQATERALAVLAGLRQLTVTPVVLNAAAVLDPSDLRSLDAIHLASALELGADLTALVTYDARQRAAAESRGLPVLAPG